MNYRESVSNLFIKAYEYQLKDDERSKKNREIQEIEDYKNNLIAQSLSFGEETKALLNNQFKELESHISEMKASNELSLENKDDFNNALVKDYLEISKESDKPVYDMMFKLESKYEKGSNEFREVIENLKNKGTDVEVVYEFVRGRKPGESDIISYDTDFVVALPSSSYLELQKELDKLEIIGSNDAYFSPVILSHERSMESYVEDIRKKCVSGNEPNEVLNEFHGLGYVKLSSSNYSHENNLHHAIKTYVSQIKDLEEDGMYEGVRHSYSKNIITSNLTYSDDERKGLQMTPLKEANRYFEKVEQELAQREESKARSERIKNLRDRKRPRQ